MSHRTPGERGRDHRRSRRDRPSALPEPMGCLVRGPQACSLWGVDFWAGPSGDTSDQCWVLLMAQCGDPAGRPSTLTVAGGMGLQPWGAAQGGWVGAWRAAQGAVGEGEAGPAKLTLQESSSRRVLTVLRAETPCFTWTRLTFASKYKQIHAETVSS